MNHDNTNYLADLEEKLAIATEALEWISKHSYVTSDQREDEPTMAARMSRKALEKIKPRDP